jgi:hypothetical protein
MLEQRAIALHQTKKQMKLMQEIARMVATPSLPLIPIKGFTGYAFTGDPAHIRWSADLDLFFCDLERLNTALQELGFSERPSLRFNQFDLVSCEDLDDQEGHPAPAVNGQHEYREMVRGQHKEVEIHGYFPVFTYPEGVAEADLFPENHPGYWMQTFPNTEGRGILYKHLRASAIPGTAPETKEFMIPEPALSVLVGCAHIFAHYLVVGPFDNWLPLKLVELAEIRDIAQDPRFNRTRFQQLLHKFGGQDAVNLTNHLLRTYLNSNALAFTALQPAAERRKCFPRFVRWWRGWATYYTPETINQLLLPASIDSMIAYLGVNTIEVSEGVSSPTFTVSAIQRDHLKRIIVHSPTGKEIPFQFSVTLVAKQLHFVVEIRQSLSTENYQYDLEVLGKNISGGEARHFFGGDSAGWDRQGRHRSVHAYPWEDTSSPFFLLLMLCLRDTQKDFFFAMDAAVLLPLKVVLAP